MHTGRKTSTGSGNRSPETWGNATGKAFTGWSSWGSISGSNIRNGVGESTHRFRAIQFSVFSGISADGSWAQLAPTGKGGVRKIGVMWQLNGSGIGCFYPWQRYSKYVIILGNEKRRGVSRKELPPCSKKPVSLLPAAIILLLCRLCQGETKMTAEIRSINPPIPPEPITHNDVTPDYFQKAWAKNRSRVIEFLSQGFSNNLSEGVVLSELGDMISKIYAPRCEMTEWQWQRLARDFSQRNWRSPHWLEQLRQKVYFKYEKRRW